MIRFRTAVAIAAAIAAGACTEQAIHPTALRPDEVKPSLQTFDCVGSIANPTVSCVPVSASPSSGTRANVQTIGGQGIYVRIATSGAAYDSVASMFSFNVTVQNFTNVGFATADGTTRDAGGVQVFFHAGPTVTGGTGVATVFNATGVAPFTSGSQPYFQYGGNSVDSAALGSDGILSPTETSSSKLWQIAIPKTATAFTFQLLVSTQTPGAFVSQAPQVSSLSVDSLVVGTTVTVNGSNFSTTPSSNIVKLGGQTAQVTGSTANSIQFVVPCVATGSAPLTITKSNMTSNAYVAPTKVPANQVRTLGVGEAVVVTDATEARCNELTATNTTTSYIVALYNINTSPTTRDSVLVSGDPLGDATAPVVAGDRGLDAALVSSGPFGMQDIAETKHMDLLKKNISEYERLRARFAGDKRMRYNVMASSVVNTPPTNMTIRLPNINVGGFCQSFYPVPATRVYYNGKIAIYEDDSAASTFKAASNPAMQDYYNKIGDQFNADMEPVLHNNFGDPLLRDAALDNNGVLIALFTPKFNTNFPGVAGFVVSCDQFPRDSAASNGSSNFGEYFYAFAPTVAGTGYSSGNTADQWYRTVRSTFIHEAKHSTAFSSRVSKGAGFEAAWLEEGSARMSEEMWGRETVYNIGWKTDYGYGSAGDPKNIYCDVRPTTAACLTNTRAPVNNMNRHFNSLYTEMFSTNARLLSPFGATPSDNASYYYANSWSLIRYAIDQYGASDAAFLTALTGSTSSGATNLTTQAGVSLAQLMGGWALSFAADNYPGLASPAGITQNKTWNLRNIMQGYFNDFGAGSYPLAWPVTPAQLSFGGVSLAPNGVYGGGILWYQISGTQTARQLLRLTSTTGGTVSSNFRVAVVRVQ